MKLSRPVALAAIIAATLPLTVASSASAAEVPDASCSVTADYGTAGGKLAQTFTALNTGQLTSATMRVNRESSNVEYVWEVRTVDMGGVPTATVLASETVPSAGLPANVLTDLTTSFSPSASVAAGQQYAMVLTRSPANVVTETEEGDPCAGGDYYFANLISDPLISPCTPACDLPLAVFVTLPPPPPTPPLVGGPGTTPVAAATGARAAAQKKCKKKRGRARARCRARANQLPV